MMSTAAVEIITKINVQIYQSIVISASINEEGEISANDVRVNFPNATEFFKKNQQQPKIDDLNINVKFQEVPSMTTVDNGQNFRENLSVLEVMFDQLYTQDPLNIMDLYDLKTNFFTLMTKVDSELTLPQVEKDLFRYRISEILVLIDDKLEEKYQQDMALLMEREQKEQKEQKAEEEKKNKMIVNKERRQQHSRKE